MCSAAFTRSINVILGVWLFFSAVLWPHSNIQQINAWVTGVLCVVFAALALRFPKARYLNTALAVWLFVSAWALDTSDVTIVWNNVLVALAILVVSLLPDPETNHEAHGLRPPPPAP